MQYTELAADGGTTAPRHCSFQTQGTGPSDSVRLGVYCVALTTTWSRSSTSSSDSLGTRMYVSVLWSRALSILELGPNPVSHHPFSFTVHWYLSFSHPHLQPRCSKRAKASIPHNISTDAMLLVITRSSVRSRHGSDSPNRVRVDRLACLVACLVASLAPSIPCRASEWQPALAKHLRTSDVTRCTSGRSFGRTLGEEGGGGFKMKKFERANNNQLSLA